MPAPRSRPYAAISIVALTLLVCAGDARAQTSSADRVVLDATSGEAPSLTLYIRRPAGSAARSLPAIVALHGCGGLLARNGSIAARERAFAAEFAALGYAVVMPDSFNSRGVREICTIAAAQRPVSAENRREDLLRAIRWLTGDASGFDGRYAIVGWSHGASTLLRTLDSARWPAGLARPISSFAFYPGCSGEIARIVATTGPLTLFIAGEDNWTLPKPCIDLAQRLRDASVEIDLHVFDGAVHGFDSPASPPRTRNDVALRRNGVRVEVKVGSHPGARAKSYETIRKDLAVRLPVPRAPTTPGS